MADHLEHRNIALAVTGSVAAYKAAELARLLMTRGFIVRVVMTNEATKFISPLLFESITGQPVSTNFFDGSEVASIGHIELADWAHCLVVAPATANIIAKLANGLADCPVSTVALATRAPLLVAPAMNVNMFEHPATQENIDLLRKRGVLFVDPEEGALACGWQGTGRLASPWEIFHHVRRAVSTHDLAGRQIVITTGPTRENIDPVRFFSNRSSGKMGVAIAREAFRRGADVTLIHGPVPVRVPAAIRCVAVESAQDMYQAVMQHTFECEAPPDHVIMAAAVADFRPKERVAKKIKKSDKPKAFELAVNPDILGELGKRRVMGSKPGLIGFAVETGEIEDLLVYAREKLKAKGCDVIIGNLAQDAFDVDTNRVWIIDRTGREEEVTLTYKSRVADRILDVVKKF